ncbi:SMP-30/gluconolactonase/LRE family protein [Cellvibrio japonicus]|uniref:Regucalcin n=1 Tax=Cellvibrio japonicus (strain Ueda107) TaxID=498211 RepID=B3PBK7_CELJU|nr:SMP-30/gluconolactonase/LRE family protein [Cellvibrio japonicus]ACE84603.1 regucalcin [Cellvibrio japonicus Ueda107]QEI13120.1 SMP-30/gluconolactonase/LRE family protein [Cellvibrio japonicus]QEI16694.1 SMP-30/gluconolactonase/LRE family protein [Cellvibrio japonicus]QEI20272.1 SMP-30/gluconolactonase/LRE family protein [Cellvibrio japonicus]
MNTLSLCCVVPCANLLGEGIQWNHRDQCFWWVDIHGCHLYRYRLLSDRLDTWPLPERLACFAFVNGDSRLLAAFASGFAWFEPDTGSVEWIARPEAGIPGNRSNDGRCDRQGRFWMGSLVEQAEGQSAGLYCLDRHLQTSRHLSGLRISNALCWSPDSSRLYHADSPTHQIRVYDFDVRYGRLSNGRIFAETEPGVEPDGACVDAQGYVWNAQWGGSRVRRYAPDGKLDFELSMPVTQPTCVALGGEQLNFLAVTSARVGLSDEQLQQQPQAGHVFIYESPFQGLRESWFTVGGKSSSAPG